MSVHFAHLCRNSFSRTAIFHLQYQVVGEERLVKIDQTFRSTVELARPVGATVPEAVQISYSNEMDHLTVLRDKIGRLRQEIADIQVLNEQFRREGYGAEAQVAHGQRNERLQAIQLELVRLADLGRKVVSTEQMREKHRSRLHLVKQKRAS
jgi:hypothetical protein